MDGCLSRCCIGQLVVLCDFVMDWVSSMGDETVVNTVFRRPVYPELPYIALAPSFEWVREWCWRNHIAVRKVRYVFELRDALSLLEYDAILFTDYIWRYDPAVIQRINERVRNTYRAELDTPIVEEGKILGWKIYEPKTK